MTQAASSVAQEVVGGLLGVMSYIAGENLGSPT